MIGRLSAWTLMLALAVASGLAQSADGPIKNVRGVVRSLRGEPLENAVVFVVNTKTNITRTLRTDGDGFYRLNGLPADGDYEVRAEFEGRSSEPRFISSFLDRTDNVLNFEMEVVNLSDPVADDASAVDLVTFDLVKLRGSFEIPEGVQAPIPTALLLHGYGENRAVWHDLSEVLLTNGWSVLTIDLRGHGQSLTRNQDTLTPDESWRRDPLQFPLDLEPALDFLRAQPRLNSGRIAVIGFDVGANLALAASGRIAEIGTIVAMSPNIEEAMLLAGSGQEFDPHTALLMVTDADAGAEARDSIRGASRVTVVSASGGTANWLAASNTINEIMRWLRDSY